jgi:hypothetical protein
MRPIDRPLPAFPEIRLEGGVDPSALPEIRRLTAGLMRHDHRNVFLAEGSEKWGRPAVHRLTGISVSYAPFEDVPAADSLIKGLGLHVSFETDQGERFGASICRSGSNADRVEGIILLDRLGRAWFCGSPAGAAETFEMTGDEPVWMISTQTTPLMRETSLEAGAELRDVLPAVGRFRIDAAGVVYGVEGPWVSPKDVDPFDRPDLHPAMASAAAYIEEVVDREEAIRAIAERHFHDGALEGLKLGRSFPIEKDLIPAYNDWEPRKAFDAEISRITRGLLEDLRREGFLAPCPNNGPRGVSSLEAWNRWLAGAYDVPESERNEADRWGERRLDEAPGFKTVQNCLIRAVVDMESKVWEAQNPGMKRGTKRRGAKGDEEPVLSEADVDAGFREACRRIVRAYAEEETADNLMSMELRGKQEGENFVLQDSFLTPVLCSRSGDYRAAPVPLPSLEAPKSVRHIEMSLPSGVLVMADWFRIPGFKEGLDSILDNDDHYEINYAKGLDARARDYFEKAGLVIVQVGNTSPAAFDDTPGVWRMGHVDEDDEIFWTEEGERRDDVAMPEEAWKTSTGLWANTFADREVVVDILMASGAYPARDDALQALVEYSKEYGVSMTDLGVDRLHVYMPTGNGTLMDDFEDVFRAAELDYPDWRNDAYVLSAAPLTVDPDIIDECGWIEGRVSLHAGPDVEDDAPRP